MGGSRFNGVNPEHNTLFLNELQKDNPILPKVNEAIKYCLSVAEKGNVDAALAPTSKAFRGFEDALGRTSFVHYDYAAKERSLVVVCAGTLQDEANPWGDLRNDRVRLPYLRHLNYMGKPVYVNSDFMALADPLIGNRDKSPLLRRLKEAIGSSTPERILVTGWQAGGVMATIIAPWLALHFPSADVRLVAVDTPAVGNRWFVQALTRMVSYSYRLVHSLKDSPLDAAATSALDKTSLQFYTPTPTTLCIVPKEQAGAPGDEFLGSGALKIVDGLLVKMPAKAVGNVVDKLLKGKKQRTAGNAQRAYELLATYAAALDTVPQKTAEGSPAGRSAAERVRLGDAVEEARKQYVLERKATLARQATLGRTGTLARREGRDAAAAAAAAAAVAATTDANGANGNGHHRGSSHHLHGLHLPGQNHHHDGEAEAGEAVDAVEAMLRRAHDSKQLGSIEELVLSNRVREAVIYANAAYEDEEGFRKMTGLGESRMVEDVELDSQAHVAYRVEDCTAIIACRGTESAKDAKTDAKFKKVALDFLPQTFPGARAHSGFVAHFLSITNEAVPDQNSRALIKQLAAGRPIRRVLCCGHSLGGAMATLAAVWAALTWPEADVMCITCGSPRVGNPDFVRMFASLVGTSVRLVYRSDPVPNLPGIGYQHVQHRIFLRPRHATFSKRAVVFKACWGVGDHLLDGYAEVVSRVIGEEPPEFCKSTQRKAEAVAAAAENADPGAAAVAAATVPATAVAGAAAAKVGQKPLVAVAAAHSRRSSSMKSTADGAVAANAAAVTAAGGGGDGAGATTNLAVTA